MDRHLSRSNINVLAVAACLLVAALSFFILCPRTTNTETHQYEIEQIDQKIDTVLELTAASTASSAIISLLPDDQATPIANKLADFSSYFLIALCALYLEKFLISLVGYASFGLLVPMACGIMLISIFTRFKFMRNLAVKAGIFALVIYFIIPLSVKISDVIYMNYADSIQATVDAAEKTANMAEDTEEGSTEEEESQSVIDKVVDIVRETSSTITGFATDILSNFIEALAVMLVTSCIIPVLVFMGLVWISKLLFSIPISDQTILNLPDEVLEQIKG